MTIVPVHPYIQLLGFSSHDKLVTLAWEWSHHRPRPATPHSDCAQSLGRAPRQCHQPIHETPASDLKKSDFRESQRWKDRRNKQKHDKKKLTKTWRKHTHTGYNHLFSVFLCVCPTVSHWPPTNIWHPLRLFKASIQVSCRNRLRVQSCLGVI